MGKRIGELLGVIGREQLKNNIGAFGDQEAMARVALSRGDDAERALKEWNRQPPILEQEEEQSVMAEKDLLWFENNVVKCSECGKVLGFDDNGNYHNYCGEPLCNDCAVTNDNGCICTMCGFKHPYNRMANSGERCIDCEDKYDY